MSTDLVKYDDSTKYPTNYESAIKYIDKIGTKEEALEFKDETELRMVYAKMQGDKQLEIKWWEANQRVTKRLAVLLEPYPDRIEAETGGFAARVTSYTSSEPDTVSVTKRQVLDSMGVKQGERRIISKLGKMDEPQFEKYIEEGKVKKSASKYPHEKEIQKEVERNWHKYRMPSRDVRKLIKKAVKDQNEMSNKFVKMFNEWPLYEPITKEFYKKFEKLGEELSSKVLQILVESSQVEDMR